MRVFLPGTAPLLARWVAAGEVTVASAVPLRSVASVHVDEEQAQDVVAAAVAAIPAADAGDDDARFALDEAEATELLWYDVTEIPDLVAT